MNKMARVRYIALDSKVLAVAVEGSVSDWTAYIGAVEGMSHEHEWQAVKDNGSKLRKEVAEVLFPDFKELAWRG